MASAPKSRKKSAGKKGAKGRSTGARRKPARRRSSSRNRRRFGGWGARLLGLAFLAALAAGLYLLYLDHTVRTRFEGKRWSIPARVYGRPLELYAGAPLSLEQFTAELSRLGYQKAATSDRPATWSRNGARVQVRTRGFLFWDGEESSRFLDLTFAGGRLASLREASGREVALARLEAPEIGSIYPAHREDRVLVQLDDLPEALVAALIAVEDRSFREHAGVDPRAILRAAWANLRAGGVVQGGSTLTQQLVKNFYLTRERSLTRKVNEALMALLLEAHYGKDEILEAYANEIYLGQDGGRAIHGFGLASHFYFNRPLGELDLPRLALLVGIIRGPSYYDPRRHPDRARARRDRVVAIMREQGLISEAAADRATAAGLGISDRKGDGRGRYPAFIDLVRRQLHRDYRPEDLASEGLRLFTTLDPWQQAQAERAVTAGLRKLEQRHGLSAGSLQAAVVVAGRENGEVQALVGDRDPGYDGFNRALDAVRPIGSLVKPAVYLAALRSPDRYTLVSRLEDREITLRGGDGKLWRPRNYDRKVHGEVPLHEALARSYNLATVSLGLELGLDRVVDVLEAMGVKRPVEAVPALLLGALSLSPLEVAQLYQTLAAGGFRSPLRAIREVLGADGTPLQRYPLTVNRTLEAGPVYLVNRALQGVVENGTGRGLSAYLGPGTGIAGKTGTTDELRDSWFAGFSGDKVAVTWIGRDDNKPAGLSGASGALQVWGDMMSGSGVVPLELNRPGDVELVRVDAVSGLRADRGCDSAAEYPFIRGSAPTRDAPCAVGGEGLGNRLWRSLFE